MRGIARLVPVACLAGALIPSPGVGGAVLVLDDPLNGSTRGTRSGGTFVPEGWKVTGPYDSIYWHVPTLVRGAVEWDVRGLQPDECRPALKDKTEIFHMYDFTFGDSDVKYSGGYRENPYKHFIRKIDCLGGSANALELLWKVGEKYVEPDSKVLVWDPAATYRFREEWGPEGEDSVIHTFRDRLLVATMKVPGVYAPAGHSIRIAASTRRATDAGAPIDAIFANVKAWDLTPSPPGAPKPLAPGGPVRVVGASLADSAGPFLGLGASHMSALRRSKYDRARLASDLAFLARCGFNYVRVLSMVGWYRYWEGIEIAPVSFKNELGHPVAAWPDYWSQLRDLVDIVASHGLRTQVTIFADAQLMPEKSARIQHMAQVLEVLAGREDKVILIEVANEAWQNGFPGSQGIADLREFGQYLASRTAIPVALSSTAEGTNASLEELYRGSAADIATEHFSRDVRAEAGWLPVRECWRVGLASGIPPLSSNEPIGPGSSVNSERDPLRLVSAAVFAFVAGLPMYVFHSSAGVRGLERFEDMPGATAFARLREILPPDLPSWTRNDGIEAAAPFTVYCDGRANAYWTAAPGAKSGCHRACGATKGEEFIAFPMGVLAGGLEIEARRPVAFKVVNPFDGAVVLEASKTAGERFALSRGPGAYVISGRYSN